jgi:aquaporin Z
MSLSRRLLAEFLGTYFMLFAGTGAIVINHATGAITHLGVALTWGMVVMVLIYALGDCSGAHFNPAVSLGFVAAGRFPAREFLPYLGAQIAGGLAASGTIHALFPADTGLGGTLPAGSAGQSFVLELLLTLFLMLVILNVSHGAKEKGITAGIAVGATIGLEALFAGPICGASMNPVRSLAPALVSGQTQHLWIYMTAPVLGALIAVSIFRVLRADAVSTLVTR